MTTPIIIKQYFDTIRDLLKYEINDEISEATDKILYSILENYNCTNKFQECFEIINKTNCIKTIADGLVLNINKNIENEDKFYLQLKSDILEEEKISKTYIFNKELFIKNIITKSLKGNIYSNKLLAVLNLEGIFISSNMDKALYYYQILSYADDQYSMCCLSKIYQKLRNFNLSQDWINIREILEIINDLYFVSIKNKYVEFLSDNANQILKIILALRNRHLLMENNQLDISIINYVINTKNSLMEILNNINNININGNQLLVKEDYFNNNFNF